MNAKVKAVLKGIGASILLVAAKGATTAMAQYLESLSPAVKAYAGAAVRAITPTQDTVGNDNVPNRTSE